MSTTGAARGLGPAVVPDRSLRGFPTHSRATSLILYMQSISACLSVVWRCSCAVISLHAVLLVPPWLPVHFFLSFAMFFAAVLVPAVVLKVYSLARPDDLSGQRVR